jgi:hypothetical protein
LGLNSQRSLSEEQWGKVDYEIEDKNFLLHIIESHPEKGTGLGGLLMYSAADEAVEADCTMIKILSAAMNERDFYYRMGCKLDTNAIKDFDQTKYSAKDWGIAWRRESEVMQCWLSGRTRPILG